MTARVDGGPVLETTPCRPLRADAARNRERILEAAEATFAAEGVSAPIDAVAERAGVGVGTVYRHFPTKEALFAAIVTTRLEALRDLTQELAETDESGEALFPFLMELGRQASAKQDLFDAMDAAGLDIKSACAFKVDELMSGIAVLLKRAQAAGKARRDVTSEEIMALITGACHSGQADAICQRMVEIVCDGLRVQPTGQPSG
jgi:AcrR family transcriptional regulator